jgi:hypothetical protein
MPQNINGTTHVDRYLTNYSVSFMQDAANFVALAASTQIPVSNQSDLYAIYDKGYFFRDEMEPRPLGGAPTQVGYKLSQGTYSAVEYATEHVVDDRQRANVDTPISLDQNATRLLSSKAMINRDRKWATSFFKSGVWGLDLAGVSSSPSTNQFIQFDQAASNPIQTIDLYKDYIAQRTGMTPNTIVLGSKVKRVLRTNADIVDRIKYTRVGLAEEDLLASLFGVEKVVTPRSIYNSAAEGATDSFSFIVPETGMWMGYVERTPSLDSPTAIASFNWTGLLGGSANQLGGVITRGRDDRAYSDYFHIRSAYDMRAVSTELGIWFGSTVA